MLNIGKDSISVKMLDTLCDGKERLGKEGLSRVRQFVKSQQVDGAVFINKSGKEDLYYTMFGLMLSYALDIRTNKRQVSGWLDKQDTREMDLIHYTAYIRCKMILSLMQGGKIGWSVKRLLSRSTIERELERVSYSDRHSPYNQFVMLSLTEDMGISIKNKGDMVRALEHFHVPGGGYSNLADAETTATNATAAALCVMGELKGYRENEDVRFLRNLQEDSGGFRASVQSPLPDLLSTATALFALRCYEVKPWVSPDDFIEVHWLDSGGFSPTIVEEKSDVEYTFYALLALGWKQKY